MPKSGLNLQKMFSKPLYETKTKETKETKDKASASQNVDAEESVAHKIDDYPRDGLRKVSFDEAMDLSIKFDKHGGVTLKGAPSRMNERM